MIVLHESESALKHSVLEVRRRIHGGDFTSQVLPHTQVLGPPGNALTHADQSGGDSGRRHSHFPAMLVSRKMDFHTSSEVETPFDRRLYHCKLFEFDHERTATPYRMSSHITVINAPSISARLLASRHAKARLCFKIQSQLNPM